MRINLNNFQVLLTRPERQSEALFNMIIAAGGHPIRFPAIAFSPPNDIEQFHQAIAMLGEQDWLLFISPQAVYSAVPAIRSAWPVFAPTVKFAAAGKGTAKALQAAGYHAQVYPQAHAGTDGLLELAEFHNAKGLKIAVIRGLGGREIIDKELANRGAQVLSVIAYQRVLPHSDNSAVIALLKEHKIQVIVCTSFDSVNNLQILIGQAYWPLLKKIPLCVVSMRIKKLANDLGFETIWVTQEMSDSAILQLLGEKRSE